MSWLFSALKWVRDFRRVYKRHKVDMRVDEEGTHIVLDVVINVPEDKARAILKGLDDFMASLAKGRPVGEIAEKIQEIKEEAEMARELVRRRRRRINPLHLGVV